MELIYSYINSLFSPTKENNFAKEKSVINAKRVTSIADIPSEILCEIFDIVYNQVTPSLDQSYYSRLANFRPITGVCRLWRELSLPVFYKTVICEEHVCEITDKNAKIAPCVFEYTLKRPIFKRVRQNIDLVVSGGYTHFAKTLWIGFANDKLMPSDSSYQNKIQCSLDKCNFHSVEWPNIKHIDYCEAVYVGHVWIHGSDRLVLFKYLASCLPNADSFVCHNLINSVSDDIMTLGTFVDAFSTRLKKLHISSTGWSNISLNSALSHFSRELTYLHLDLRQISHSNGRIINSDLAKVFAPSLKHLCLSIDPDASTWDSFYDDQTGSPYTEFTSLKALEIHTCATVLSSVRIQDTLFGMTVRDCRFPALESLSLEAKHWNEPDFLSLFGASSTRLRALCLDAYSDTHKSNIYKIGTSVFAPLKSLTIKVKKLQRPYNYNSLIRKLQINMHEVRRMDLSFDMECVTFVSLPSNIGCWTSLWHLTINARVDVKTVSGFISSLVNLKTFVLYIGSLKGYRFKKNQKEDSDIPAGGFQHAISNSLRDFRVNVEMEQRIRPEFAAVYSEIVLATPSLKKIGFTGSYYWEIVKYIRKFAGDRTFAPVLRDLQVIPTLPFGSDYSTISPCCPFN